MITSDGAPPKSPCAEEWRSRDDRHGALAHGAVPARRRDVSSDRVVNPWSRADDKLGKPPAACGPEIAICEVNVLMGAVFALESLLDSTDLV
jgi:hypothetical protein